MKFIIAVGSDHYVQPLEADGEGVTMFINLGSEELTRVCPEYDVSDSKDGEPGHNDLLACRFQDGIALQRQLIWRPCRTTQSVLTSYPESTLVQYYLEVISASRVYVPTETNPFLSLVLPVVFRQQGPLYSTVLAMSACEMSLQATVNSQMLQVAANRYKTEAIRKLQATLNSPSDAEESLLTCLLQASLEISEGSRPTWLNHLRGALAIIQMYGDQIRSATISAALQYFHFRLALMRTTQAGHALLTQPQQDDSTDAELHNLITHHSKTHGSNLPICVDARSGCSAELLGLIGEVSRLSAASGSTGTPLEIRANALAMEQRIKDAHFVAEDDLDDYLVKSAECFRVAALIYLHTAVYGTPASSHAVMVLHARLLSNLGDVIYEGQPRRSFPMWPLFIAGCFCSDDNQKKAVLKFFNLLDSQWPISNISTVKRVVWTIWQTREFSSRTTDTQQQRDWQDIIEKFGWKLSLS